MLRTNSRHTKKVDPEESSSWTGTRSFNSYGNAKLQRRLYAIANEKTQSLGNMALRNLSIHHHMIAIDFLLFALFHGCCQGLLRRKSQ